MTDRVQKIREEVARIQLYTQSEVLKQVLDYIDKVQEGTVTEDLEGAAQEYVTKEGYLAGLHYNSMVRSFKAGAEWYAFHNTKLPDNLLLAARKASIDMRNIDDKYLDEYPYNPITEQKFIEGAKWQKEQIKRAMDLGEPPYLISVEQAYYRTLKLLE